jgi:hypothetical protein
MKTSWSKIFDSVLKGFLLALFFSGAIQASIYLFNFVNAWVGIGAGVLCEIGRAHV